MAYSTDLESALRKLNLEASDSDERPENALIGGNFNDWNQPVYQVGPDENSLEYQLGQNPYVGNVNFNRRREWARAREATTAVLNLILKKIQEDAKKYEGLVIQKYLCKGSSREGLKTRAADEFDVLLQFHIEGLRFTYDYHEIGAYHLIEFGEIKVQDSLKSLEKRFPCLYRNRVFVEHDGKVLLSSQALHERVFESLIDKAVHQIKRDIQNNYDDFPFNITRKRNPPAINITITIQDENVEKIRQMPVLPESARTERERIIDVDVVPGLLIYRDKLPNPRSNTPVDCPSHAIFRWMTKEHSEKAEVHSAYPEALWRLSTTGFEAYTFDIARMSEKRRYIMTAMRVLKTYMSKTKEVYKEKGTAPPPITTVLASYHLKHVVLYAILFLDQLNKIPLSGVKEAIGYIVDLLQVSLEEKSLPHFFRGNKHLEGIFPSYTYDSKSLAYDFLGRKSTEARQQAKLSLENDLRVHLKDFIKEGAHREKVKDMFKEFIRSRRYTPGSYGFRVDILG